MTGARHHECLRRAWHIRAREEGRSGAAGAREFWGLARTVGPDVFVTQVRDVLAERVAVGLARDTGGDVDALRVEARAAITRDVLRCMAGGWVQ